MRNFVLPALLAFSSIACNSAVSVQPQCEADEDCADGQICQLPECICVDAPTDASAPPAEPDAATPESDAAAPAAPADGGA